MEHNNVFGYARFRGDKVYDLTPTKAFYVEDISGRYNVLSIKKSNASAPTITVEKSTDGINWESMDSTSTTAITATIPAYGKLYLRARADRWCDIHGSYYNTITASERHNIGGNILSLLHGSTFTGYTRNLTSTNTYAFTYLFLNDTNLVSAENLILNTTLANYCYQYMFQNCTSLTTAPALPATTLANYCYRRMFSGCTSLTTTPALPATTLAQFCYSYMFYGCTSLITVPSSLPATTLAIYCYQSMFYGCRSLTIAPALPATTLATYCYYYMFYGCTSLTTAPALPATTLTESCYHYMFSGCTSLTTAPALPATTLSLYCYYSMFNGCTALTTAPALPATTLAQYCYSYMFYGCTSLTTVPSSLPATTLAESCYTSMFQACTSLTTAPALPTTTLARNCYASMFRGCTSLTTAPALPATTLTNYCYQYMFQNCTSLTTAPALPATTLANYCYQYMFQNCTSLTTTPALPATTLATYCYYYMFYGCTALTTAPKLPATTLAQYCYSYMFYGCTHLNYIKCLATNISASNCLYYWVFNVAATGTFVKDANMTSWPTGSNGIPSSWVVRNCGIDISQDLNVVTINTLGCDSGTAYYTINGGSHITITQDITTIPITQAMDGQTLYVYAEYDGKSDEKTLTLSWTDYSPAVSISVSDNYATITSATADTILYRLGSSGNYSTYTGPIYIAETITLYVQATKTVSGVDYTNSTSQVVTHTAIPPSNLVISCSSNTVTITADHAQTIQYRFSTSDPWTTYTAPFAITETVTVYAQVSNNDGTISGSQVCEFKDATYENFANAVNTAYPNKLKHLHQNYSVNDDGLYYVTIESGTSNGSSKTLVVGDGTGILATKTVTVTGWGGYMDRCNFAYHGYFGFVGRTSDSTGSTTYLSLFKYENGEITNIQTGTSINVMNWLSADCSCFTFNGKDYIQGRSNSSRETFFMYNLTDRTLIRKELSERIGGVGIGNNGTNFVYLLAGVNNNTRGLGVCQTSNITSLSTTAISNVLSAYAKKTYRRLPVIGGDDRYYVWDTDWYRITISNDYSTISVAATADFTQASMPNINYGTNFILEDNDRWYYNSSTKNIEKVAA